MRSVEESLSPPLLVAVKMCSVSACGLPLAQSNETPVTLQLPSGICQLQRDDDRRKEEETEMERRSTKKMTGAEQK